MDSHLVDRIYESAFVPEMWPDVLGELARTAEASSGVLHVSDGETHRATASPLTTRMFIAPIVKPGLVWKSPIVTELERLPSEGFVRETDVARTKAMTADELRAIAQDDFFYRLLCGLGGGRGAGVVINLPTKDRLYFSVARQWEKGPVEDRALHRLNELRPHLARAGYMAARLQLTHARVASQTLASLGLAALVLDDAGKVLAANELIEAQSAFIRWRAQDRFSFVDSCADALLHGAIAGIAEPAAGVRSFPVRGGEGEAALVAHVIPIRRAAQDIFSRCAAALALTPVTAPGAPPVELVQSLFDLTPAEARVACGVATGRTLDDIASDNGVAASTVRTQMRAIFDKTGCGRQAEVAALLVGVSAVRLGGSIPEY